MLRRLLFVVPLLASLLLAPLAASAQAPTGKTFDVSGLDGEVTIRYDDWGVPNIYATTPHDLIMAQGFVHAADRWWQMEWFRHQGEGRLSEIAGSSLLDTDRYLRTLGLARNAQNDLDHASPEVLDLLQAYADGVNAWLAGKKPVEAAIEYQFLNTLRRASGAPEVTEIEPWTPLNSATWLQIMSLSLSGNAYYELVRAQVIAASGQEGLSTLAPGYDYETYPLIMEPGWTMPDDFPAAPDTAPITTARVLPGLETLGTIAHDVGLGSNNWVVSGVRTESGMPLLANDPHLGIMMPSIWYEIGLHCTTLSDACPYDVSGFSFAGTPFVVVGHNARIGWGVTNVGTDVQDLYRLDINPDNPLQYRVDGEWLDMDVITETIAFWDADPVEIEIHLTRFGPVVDDVFGAPDPVALRWAAAEPNRNFESLMLLGKAANWDDFQAAVADFDLAAQNFVYADTDGNIGYIMSGRVPLRVEGHDGTVPVDGSTTANDWLGFVDPMDNPRLFNPDAGVIVTANNAVLAPEDFPTVINLDWAYGYRTARISALIEAIPLHTPETFAAIQFDNFNSGAAIVVPALAAADLGDARLNDAAAWLAGWDYQNAADSPQAALFNVFWDRFLPLVFDELPFYEDSFSMYRLSLMVDHPEHPIWANADLGTSDPAVLMAQAMGDALDWMEAHYGPDREAWRWGVLHVAPFQAVPLGQIPEGLDPALDQMLPLIFNLFNRETETSGGGEIINATGWDVGYGSFEVNHLPSMRMILDFSDFDRSRTVHTTGQSGNPSSPHYADQMPLWAVGESHAHAFSPAAVEASTAALWTLSPAGGE
ncbi:MAG TPA: penicillin acylase family protein [Aggregatilinea sp.]|uniref:penicillin acylase family protein n=1 Tax=Aggregatilinea sp. TaxID=2806333 RepID=UPI002C34DDE6|nr:penicillin acylase family protein [Aggregatilinea sp.]HML20698.1 penicillin acylase family protein [Aggregatilinea sp.]